ncbi:MAG: STAS domain-containing protein [Verrucomicrobiota bacterium]
MNTQENVNSYAARGDILSTNATLFWGEVSPFLERILRGQTLELDLRASTMVDSVGLNAIVKVIKSADNKGAKVRLLISSENLKRICAFTRLDQKAEIVGP